jgi:FkbM family methyltransferase
MARSRIVRSVYGACRRVPLLGSLLHAGVDGLLPHGSRAWTSLPKGMGKGLRFYCDPRFELGYMNGDHEPWAQEILQEHLRPGDCFCDVGAHTGFFSLIAARFIGGKGLVVALEADPENATLLRLNAGRNGMRQVWVVEAAAWSSSGQLKFQQASATSNRTEGRVASNGEVGARGFTVAAVTLDDLFFTKQVRTPQLVKIDVEGAEWEVLKGAQRTLRELKPSVLCEVHEPAEIGKIRSFLGGLGYATEHSQPSHVRYPDYKQNYVWATKGR